MNKDQIIKLAAEAAVEATLKTLEEEREKQVKQQRDKRLRNTKLLFKNYTLLKEHCDKSISSFSTAIVTDRAVEILESLENCGSDVYVESITKSVARTYTIITHINKMVELYKLYCQSSERDEDIRRFRILEMMYLSNEKCSVSQACEAENIDESTFYRDSRENFKTLSALIFGIDGLSAMRKS